jgi:sugar phosphate isomerase/epimerase
VAAGQRPQPSGSTGSTGSQPGFTPSSYSYLWRTGLPDAIEDMARGGFERTEVMAALPHVDLWERGADLADEINAARKRAGLLISGLNPPGLDINIGSSDASMREWSVAMYIAIGRLAAEVDARYLVVHPGRLAVLIPPPADMAREWVLASVAEIARALEPTGVQVLFENTPTGLLDTGEECVGVVRHIGAPNLGLVYDVANGFMVEDPNHGLRMAAELLEVIHLSDTTRARWRHDPVGTGDVDFAALAATVADIGFDGEVVLETVHPDAISEGLGRDRTRLQTAGWKR